MQFPEADGGADQPGDDRSAVARQLAAYRSDYVEPSAVDAMADADSGGDDSDSGASSVDSEAGDSGAEEP